MPVQGKLYVSVPHVPAALTQQKSHVLNSLAYSITDSSQSFFRNRPAAKESFFTFRKSVGCVRRFEELHHKISLCFSQRDSSRADVAEKFLSIILQACLPTLWRAFNQTAKRWPKQLAQHFNKTN
jgi:hypothetical protein